MTQPRFDGTFAGWRTLARAALAAESPPHATSFAVVSAPQAGLFDLPRGTFDLAATPRGNPAGAFRLPRAFVAAAQIVAVHADPTKWDLLYRIAWRLLHGEPQLLQIPTDQDVVTLMRLQRAVLRDVHHCHAYVRFRRVAAGVDADGAEQTTYVAWYEPDHAILPLAAPHFVARLGRMNWSILTPAASCHHASGKLRFGPGAKRADAPQHDELEALWRTYYAHIFNPARLNLAATRSEMPKRFWPNMPETDLIEDLRRQAPKKAQAFLDAQPPRAAVENGYVSLAALQRDLAGCKVCPWSHGASQVVFGQGPTTAPLMLVGEQPGDAEDVAGSPFVGPAGQVLRRALADAQLDVEQLYLTNAVKHFKFSPRGKRRIHQKPNATDVAACKGWLAAEVALVRPRVLVCLGATAALAIRGQLTKLAELRGRVVATGACSQTVVTCHPSAILRTEGAQAQRLYAQLVADLSTAAGLLAATATAGPSPSSVAGS